MEWLGLLVLGFIAFVMVGMIIVAFDDDDQPPAPPPTPAQKLDAAQASITAQLEAARREAAKRAEARQAELAKHTARITAETRRRAPVDGDWE